VVYLCINRVSSRLFHVEQKRQLTRSAVSRLYGHRVGYRRIIDCQGDSGEYWPGCAQDQG
jgi:hypothetical protein